MKKELEKLRNHPVILEAKEKLSLFNTVQDRLNSIYENIENNKKTLMKMEKESQNTSENLLEYVNELGEIDFSMLDKNSKNEKNLSLTKDKIEKLRGIIKFLEDKAEYVYLTEYIDAYKNARYYSSKAFNLLYKNLLDYVLSQINLDNISYVYSAFILSSPLVNDKSKFIDLLSSKLSEGINRKDLSEELSYPNAKYKTNISGFEYRDRLASVEKRLNISSS